MLAGLAFTCLALRAPPRATLAGGIGRGTDVAHAMPRRTALLGASALCALSAVGPARADEDCMAMCMRECKQLVPGNDGYCAENCQTACASIAAKESSDASLAQSASTAAVDDAPDVPRGSSGSVGIFGRSSDNGVERFAATLFGATKQGSDPRVADRDAFVGDVVDSFKTGVLKAR